MSGNICNATGQHVNNVPGLIFKMKDGRWRMRISTDDLTGVDVSKPYSCTLDKKEYILYSLLAEFGIDLNTIDDKYYQYNVELEGGYLYCYAYTENCVRAGMVHYLKKFCSNFNKITLTKGIQYHIYRNNDEMKTDVEGNKLNPISDPIDDDDSIDGIIDIFPRDYEY
jgi:hypothetical protein